MLNVAEALDLVLGLVAPLPSEPVTLRNSFGRTLARDIIAHRDQPPFAASAMDGYAVHGADVAEGATFTVVGEAAAGHRFAGDVGQGQAVRIFTGAPLPNGLDYVVIQEDVVRSGDEITVQSGFDTSTYVRPSGADFKAGDTLSAPRVMTPSDVALAASMNAGVLDVTRKPRIALMATGDELVIAGETPAPDQIIASNTFGLAAMVEALGAEVQLLPIARDSVASLTQAFTLAKGADVVVTVGGASVGDHDLVGQVASELGLDRAFYKIAMRPGKPLMAGHFQGGALLGLPGNPVSAMVCGKLFLEPMIRKMLGATDVTPGARLLPLTASVGKNGPRAHYMRGVVQDHKVRVFDRQDSALLTVLNQANCLIVRPPHDPERPEGFEVMVIDL